MTAILLKFQTFQEYHVWLDKCTKSVS